LISQTITIKKGATAHSSNLSSLRKWICALDNGNRLHQILCSLVGLYGYASITVSSTYVQLYTNKDARMFW